VVFDRNTEANQFNGHRMLKCDAIKTLFEMSNTSKRLAVDRRPLQGSTPADENSILQLPISVSTPKVVSTFTDISSSTGLMYNCTLSFTSPFKDRNQLNWQHILW